jgi:hypothetical protein
MSSLSTLLYGATSILVFVSTIAYATLSLSDFLTLRTKKET